MNSQAALIPEFVEFFPETLEDDKIYVSMIYATVIHKCCCGCGNDVVTPLSPAEWKLTFDGETISLRPSIGNWEFPCQSHYWVQNNEIMWADQWSRHEIEAGRAKEASDRKKYFDDKEKDGKEEITYDSVQHPFEEVLMPIAEDTQKQELAHEEVALYQTWLQKIKTWFFAYFYRR